ncbi:MAG: GNAT family N-acetyltransferase [Thiohalobacterales bacterium]|nr:GNAT family N-acetyltransferase [Thiohalobacterales bacterium]
MQRLREGIRSAWSHLSPRSRYYRFGYVAGELSRLQLDYLVDLDNRDRLAWCAAIEDGAETIGIGLARYVRLADEPEVAEFAVTVVDEHQHAGLGSLLLARLLDSAARAGLAVLRGYVRRGNKAMIALARKYGGVEHLEDEWLRIDIPVSPDLPAREAEIRPADAPGDASRRS